MTTFFEKLKSAVDGWRNAGQSIHRERFRIPIQGMWRDTYEWADGRRLIGPWKRNQIQNAAPILVGGLLRRAGELAFPGFTGITYIGYGSGNVSWDITPPVQDAADTTLTLEYFRKIVPNTDLFFLDPLAAPGSAPVAGPTRRVGFVGTLLPAEGNGSLREFGLFGGLASGTLDSGTILNWIVHPLITKDATLTITRNVEITVLEP